MKEILNHYEANGTVKSENIDMIANPASVARFRSEHIQLTANSITVTNEDESRFRIITQSQLYDYEFDNQLQRYTKYDFIGEQASTSAILYVTSENTPIVYFLQGHNEVALEK